MRHVYRRPILLFLSISVSVILDIGVLGLSAKRGRTVCLDSHMKLLHRFKVMKRCQALIDNVRMSHFALLVPTKRIAQPLCLIVVVVHASLAHSSQVLIALLVHGVLPELTITI